MAMNKLKFYKYATVVLLLINFGLLAFFFLHPGPPRGPKRKGKNAQELMKLDDEQHELFLQMAKAHQLKMKNLDGLHKNALDRYFNTLISDSLTSEKKNLLEQVQLLERQKVESTYQHLVEIKSILKSEQMADYEVFVDHALKIILLQQKKGPPPPKDFK